MIDIDEVNEIRKQKIAAEFRERIDELDKDIDNHKQVFSKVLLAKDEAEQAFPTILENVENRIKRTISSASNFTYYTFDQSSKDTFIVSMLIPALTLNGFACKLRENKLDISW